MLYYIKYLHYTYIHKINNIFNYYNLNYYNISNHHGPIICKNCCWGNSIVKNL